jgi:hypothetical protein
MGTVVCDHVVMITNVTNVRLENLVIRRGNASGGSYPNDRGGGIYVSNVSYLVIESNVVISNNSAQYARNTTISGSVYNNRLGLEEGCICIIQQIP